MRLCTELCCMRTRTSNCIVTKLLSGWRQKGGRERQREKERERQRQRVRKKVRVKERGRSERQQGG